MTHNLTDVGNAHRFMDCTEGRVRFCGQRGEWLGWNGKVWTASTDVTLGAMMTARNIYAEAAAEEDADKRKALVAWARQSESAGRIKSMVELAKSLLSVGVAELDSDPWLLNVANGTIDLRTGALHPHNREQFITKMVDVEYDPEAECPEWEQFISWAMQGDKDTVGFVQRAVGYSLTGLTGERALFLLYGKGQNGKSVFLEVIRDLLGGYASRTPTQTLMAKRSESVSNDVARLQAKRFVSASETEEGHKLAAALVKDLTGGDTVVARMLYREFFEFRPEFKLWLATNHKPDVSSMDQALWDRIKLIPFVNRIGEDERDPELRERLVAREAAGILAWAVRGCLEWQAGGLGSAEAVRRAGQEYRVEQDQAIQFLTEGFTHTHNYADTVPVKQTFIEYLAWAAELGEEPLGMRDFNQRLERLGLVKTRASGGMVWHDVKRSGGADTTVNWAEYLEVVALLEAEDQEVVHLGHPL